VSTTLVDREWLEANFPCHAACPVGTEAGRYVALIAEGVAIRALKRFATERFGVESMIDLDMLREIYGKRGIRHPDDRVAVIGAGPAGLAAAHDLALHGYPVTIFEAQPVAGGMLRLGIPEYRLPRELINLEISSILSLGVELRVHQRLGRDFSLGDLRRQGFRAAFLAIGAHKGRELDLPGKDLDGVVNGIDFLLNANLGYRLDLGQRVVVVGGGDVAIDVARTALRTVPPAEIVNPEINIVTALDVARSAIRFGAREVHVVSLESMEQMPADAEEIRQAGQEGIVFHPGRGPSRMLGEDGRVVGLETIECASVFDGDGRFNPSFRKDTELAMAADSVILAIGQKCDLSFVRPEDGITVSPRGTIEVDPETLATTAPGIYAGGDVAFGPRIAITAIADGRRAAAAIHAHLRGMETAPDPVEVVLRPLPGFAREMDYEGIPRQRPPVLPIGRRVGIAEIEQCFAEHTARLEASRCLRCWINTIFDEDPLRGGECILCGGCADVCPENCIEFVPLWEIAADPALREDVLAEHGEPGAALFEGGQPRGVALIKDETACIRCGLCAQRCPAGTIRMEEFVLEERADGKQRRRSA
jgi:NADPH-dependent glutamate synthase beta subunit-like oxidoreductase/ferredoxin